LQLLTLLLLLTLLFFTLNNELDNVKVFLLNDVVLLLNILKLIPCLFSWGGIPVTARLLL